jgi:hypothetical protein
MRRSYDYSNARRLPYHLGMRSIGVVLALTCTPGFAWAATRADAKQQRQVLVAEMEQKTLVPEDLPVESAQQWKRAESALKRGDFDQAIEHYQELRGVVSEIAVDQALVDAKRGRVPPAREVTQDSAIEKLLDRVAEACSAGDWVNASKILNEVQKRIVKLQAQKQR